MDGTIGPFDFANSSTGSEDSLQGDIRAEREKPRVEKDSQWIAHDLSHKIYSSSPAYGITSKLDSTPSKATGQHRIPPRNANREIFCDHPDRTEEQETFPRVCEWNKHMAYHERPHRCLEPGCEQIPGFATLGGLLRHDRETSHFGLQCKVSALATAWCTQVDPSPIRQVYDERNTKGPPEPRELPTEAVASVIVDDCIAAEGGMFKIFGTCPLIPLTQSPPLSAYRAS